MSEQEMSPVSIIAKTTYLLSPEQLNRTRVLMGLAGRREGASVPEYITKEVFAMGGHTLVDNETYSKDGIHLK